MKKIILLLVALFAGISASAQYVFLIPEPGNGGEVRVATSIEDLGIYQNGTFVEGVEPGETVYFDFRPFTGWQFTEVTCDEDLSVEDISVSPDGIYSFSMPRYEGETYIMIYVHFEKIPEVVTGVDINETNFPDSNFRTWLLAQDYGSDAIITDAEMSGISKISPRACGIEDLTGIEFFTLLTELDISNNPEMHPEETWNRISTINLSANTKLRKLFINNNLFTSLDLSPCPDLRQLDASSNLLTGLDLSQNTELATLFCTDNQITSLDLSHNPNLGVLGCYGNQLTELDLSNNMLLEQVYCENNKITSIDIANHNKLMLFNCNDNLLSSLDVSGCTAMFQFYFYNNQIKFEAMEALVNSLETPPNGGYMVVVDLDNENPQNEMTPEQVAVARSKHWSVEAISGDDFVQYEGIEPTTKTGDANGDGSVDVNDVTTVINYILGKHPNPFNYDNANVNGDTKVDVMDVTLIINIILGVS